MSEDLLDLATKLCGTMKVQRHDCFALLKDIKRINDALVGIIAIRSRNQVSPDPRVVKEEQDKLLVDFICILRRYSGQRFFYRCNKRRLLMKELTRCKEDIDRVSAKLDELLPQFSLSLKLAEVTDAATKETRAKAKVVTILREAESLHLLMPNQEVDFGKDYWFGGRGAFRGEAVFVRILHASRNEELCATLDEIKLVSRLSHPNIVQVIGFSWSGYGDVMMVMNYVHGMNMFSLIRKYEAEKRPKGLDNEKLNIALQIAKALAYAHSLDPPGIHKELLPTNVLVTASGDVKVVGFGSYREPTLCAGIAWTSFLPEILGCYEKTSASDMVYFGILLSMLDMHEYPYAEVSASVQRMIQLSKNLLHNSLSLPFSDSTPPGVARLGQMCTSRDPQLRPTAVDAVVVLKDLLMKLD